jgi:two-component sensor histidine kinase
VLGEGAATSFALVFHELATNVAKHGALSVPSGHVRFTTRLEDARLKVTWKETGVPAPDDPAARSGFGSKLLALMVEGQMRGALDRYWEPDGLRVEIDIPALSIAPARRSEPEGASGTSTAPSR